MTEQEEKNLTLQEVAITGFQQLLLAGIANSIAEVFGEHKDSELLSIISLFSLKQDKEMISLMKEFTYDEIESFIADEEEGEERHPALRFLDKVLAIIVSLERKAETVPTKRKY